jgi:DNA-binding MarR family transcriptional regulator
MPETKDVTPPAEIPSRNIDALLLYQAHTTLAKLVERSLLPFGFSLPQMMLLGILYWDGRALVPRRIRNTMVVEAQSLTGLIDALESKGLAKRLSHPTDRRKIRVQITPKGRKLYEEAGEHSDQTVENYFSALTSRESGQLRTALTKLRAVGYPLLGLLHEAAYPPAAQRAQGPGARAAEAAP